MAVRPVPSGAAGHAATGPDRTRCLGTSGYRRPAPDRHACVGEAARRTSRIPRVRPRLTLHRGPRRTPNVGYEASPPRLSGAACHGEPPEDRRARRRFRGPDAIMWRYNASAVVDTASSHNTGAVSESRRNGLNGRRGDHRCARSADHARRTEARMVALADLRRTLGPGSVGPVGSVRCTAVRAVRVVAVPLAAPAGNVGFRVACRRAGCRPAMLLGLRLRGVLMAAARAAVMTVRRRRLLRCAHSDPAAA
ncbi:hypothetical protein ABIE45_002685 [Methylobacterium sp. OAE515]